ncbi:Transposase-like protein, IS1634 family [Crocosphaera watsonii WH 0003]|uniref:Transposase-like protein, IS1634 family n=1 Tax=Crocosphaera watsonii WH 0003 TaxID=423471 RepID=G5IZQ3_CROWT|nr:Transposase-like protein, IS1634 family [Crocosphaera watsonii WH 0003]
MKGADKIALRVAKILNKYKINKYYNLDITDSGFTYERKQELIDQEIALDGVYILRTSVDETLMDGFEVVKAYKSLSSVEEAFRCYKSIDLKVRPIFSSNQRISTSNQSFIWVIFAFKFNEINLIK